MTEDIEITWHFVSQGWDVHMCMPAVVYTVAPNNIKEWFKQRLRWNIGGVQTIKKYYWAIFGGAGMLGYFILPYFVSAWLLGITGLGFLVYRGIRRIIFELFFYNYSTQAEVARFVLSDLNLNPTVLMFFGAVILMLSFAYTFTGLLHSREKDFKTYNVFAIVGYMFFYLLSYPPLLIYSIYKFFTGKFSW
jgi:cellulose synthase/poly-beta-1,6-N-acetylglucosamine synthase-like glycosyltransferase